MWVLRDSKTGMALNVSFTIEGLYWTANENGKLLMFENATLLRIVDVEKSLKRDQTVVDHVTIGSRDGTSLRKSNKVYVEKFVPTDQSTRRAQVAECVYVDKAYRLLTRLPTNNTFEA